MINKKGHRMFLYACAAALLMFIVLISGDVSAATDKPFVWRIQSAFPPGSQSWDMVLDIAKKVEERSGGRVQMQLFEPDKIVKTNEILDALKIGVIEMAYSTGVYNAHQIPEGLVEFGLPFSFRDYKQLYKFLYEYQGGEPFKMLQNAYRKSNLHLMMVGNSSAYGYLTKFPVNSLADFKGKKIRSFGLFGSLVTMLGGEVASIPNAEQFTALKNGIVDGTIFPIMSMDSYGFHRVVNHIVKPPVLATPTFSLYVNAEKWDSLPEELQKVVSEIAYRECKNYSEAMFVQEDQSIAKVEEEFGVQVNKLPESDVIKLEKMSQRIWEGIRAKSETNSKYVEMLKTFLVQENAGS